MLPAYSYVENIMLKKVIAGLALFLFSGIFAAVDNGCGDDFLCCSPPGCSYVSYALCTQVEGEAPEPWLCT